MAHRFSNFAQAYNYLETRWSIAHSMYDTALDMCDEADNYANAGNFKWGIRYCVYAIKAALSASDILLENYGWSFDSSVHAECFYWASQEGGNGEIDMSAILDAMWAAKPYECLLFIPMIDAMRGSIQNKTVTSEYMANALRHFLQ